MVMYANIAWLNNSVVFTDLHKAFDTVYINILLSKLSLFGISGVELQWFSSYLTGRSQSVIFDGHLSNPLPVTIGVPQGSIIIK